WHQQPRFLLFNPAKTTPTLFNLKRLPKYRFQNIRRPQIWSLQNPNHKVLSALGMKKPDSRGFKGTLSPSSPPG
ncbi:uncharacterized protein J3R85_007375, partial [Psidium guajava]